MVLPRSFVMTASGNDVSGLRGEAYILIPLAARDRNKSFWEWPASYPDADGIAARAIRLEEPSGAVVSRIYFHDGKREFRFCTSLYRAGLPEGSLYQIDRLEAGKTHFSIFLHPPGSPTFAELAEFATTWVGSSNKRWGYVS